VELELHSGLLRDHGIVTLDDFISLPHLVYPKHVQFVDFDWNRLERYLIKKNGGHSSAQIAAAHAHATSISRLQRHLRQNDVFNPNRFLKPSGLNEKIVRALYRWARTFQEGVRGSSR